MKSKNNNSIITFFCSQSFVWLFIGYMIFGAFVVAGPRANGEYFDIFLGSLLDFKFRILFLLPSFLLIFYHLYQFLNEKSDIIIRLKTRKKYLWFELKNIILVTLCFYLITLLILAIMTNLLPKTGNALSMGSGFQNEHYIFIVLLGIIKPFFTIIIFGFINFLIINITNNKTLSTIISFMYMFIIDFTIGKVSSNKIAMFFNPGFQSFGLEITDNILITILTTILYYVLVIGIILIIYIKNLNKVNIGLNNRK